MTDLVFFYGTLMSGFKRAGRSRVDAMLTRDRPRLDRRRALRPGHLSGGDPVGRLHASAAKCIGCRMARTCSPSSTSSRATGRASPTRASTRRVETPVTFEDGRVAQAWVYFYNAPLGQAQRIESGDYLEHLKMK